MKNLVAFGCSFTKDNYQRTWVDFLAEKLNLNSINHGARGAGIDFITKRIVSCDFNKKNDFVVVMFPSADRFDIFVEKNDILYKKFLKIASWLDGKSPKLVDLSGKFTTTESGFCLSGGWHRGIKKSWYSTYYSNSYAVLNYWTNVLLLQNYFENNNINYLFTSAYDRDCLIEQDVNKNNLEIENINLIVNKINFEKFFYVKNNIGFINFCKNHKISIIDDHHPDEKGHYLFSIELFNYITKLNSKKSVNTNKSLV